MLVGVQLIAGNSTTEFRYGGSLPQFERSDDRADKGAFRVPITGVLFDRSWAGLSVTARTTLTTPRGAAQPPARVSPVPATVPRAWPSGKPVLRMLGVAGSHATPLRGRAPERRCVGSPVKRAA